MKVFKEINKGSKCLICNTNDDGEVVLIGVVGTEKDGNMEAKQVHLKCLNLYYYPESNVIAQKIKKELI